MPDENYCVLPSALLPLSSREPIWEWDIVSDTIFLSQGALNCLKITAPPRKMADFYSLLQPETASELSKAREEIISGKRGSSAECSYLCNGLHIREFLLVLARNSEGRATRVMGSFHANPWNGNKNILAPEPCNLAAIGMWVYDVASKLVWMDNTCAAVLGQEETCQGHITVKQALKNVHQADQIPLRRHFALFCQSGLPGEEITDIIRICNSSGEFIPFICRASIIRRDPGGKALAIAGMIAASRQTPVAMTGKNPHGSFFNGLNRLGNGQWAWDTNGDYTYLCDRFVEMLGYPQSDCEKIGANWRSLIHPDDLQKVERQREAAIRNSDGGDTFECTYRMRRADGGWAWLFDRGWVTWRDAEGRAGHMIGSITNITTAQAERDKLEDLVRHDALTGLRSRAFLNLEMEHIEQNAIRPVAIISVDISGLKLINDSLGHARGDEVLTRAANILRGALRRSDCIARVGGDEFLCLFPSCNHAKGQKLLAKIKTAFHTYNDSNPQLPVYAAFGLASTESADESLARVISRADKEMYKYKRGTKPQVLARLKQWIQEVTDKNPAEDDRLV